jgi:hypothetical protein
MEMRLKSRVINRKYELKSEDHLASAVACSLRCALWPDLAVA